jgi:ATP-dependent Clp protease adaptor protein ClpS
MTSKETKKRPEKHRNEKSPGEYSLVLHNDEVHSFEYVIDSLIDICEHNYEQAVQCTIITHHKGSCDIRKGTFESLKQMKDALTEKELSVTINSKP